MDQALRSAAKPGLRVELQGLAEQALGRPMRGARPRRLTSKSRPVSPVVVFFGLMTASLGELLLLPPMPQDRSYHLFADCRAVAGIPNFWNAVSNIPFLAVGAAGLCGPGSKNPAIAPA